MILKEFQSLNKGLGQFQITIDKTVWEKLLAEALQQIVKQVKVAGFRQGHAPLNIAQKQINPQQQIRTASRMAVPKAYDYLKQQTTKLQPYSQLNPKIIEATFTNCLIGFIFELPMKAAIKTYEGFNIEYKEPHVTTKDVTAELKLLQKQFALTEEVKTAMLEDLVTINYTGYVNGKAFLGGSAENYQLELGSHRFIDNFEEQLVGATPQSKKEVIVTFPADYAKPNLRNKQVQFKVEILKIERRILPAVDLELVKDVNIAEIKTVAALKKHIKTELGKKQKIENDKDFFEKLGKKVAADSQLVFPNQILKRRMEELKKEFETKILESRNLKLADFYQISGMNEREIEDNLYSDAYEDLCLITLKNAVLKAKNITASETEITDRYENVAKLTKITVKELKTKWTNPVQMENIIINEKVSALLIQLNKATKIKK